MVVTELDKDAQMMGKSYDSDKLASQGAIIGQEIVLMYPEITAQQFFDMIPLVRRMHNGYFNFVNITKTFQSEEYRQYKEQLSRDREPKRVALEHKTDIALPLYTTIANMLREELIPTYKSFGNMVDYQNYFTECDFFKRVDWIESQMIKNGADSNKPIYKIPPELLEKVK